MTDAESSPTKFFEDLSRAIVAFGREAQPYVEAFQNGMKALASKLPPPEELARMAKVIEQRQRWVERWPELLKEALAESSSVLHQELSFNDAASILDAFESRGVAAAVRRVHELNEELLASSSFRAALTRRWLEAGRAGVIGDALAAYDAGLYFAAVPAALAQAEGIVADFFGLPGFNQKVYQSRLTELLESDGLELHRPLVDAFLNRLLAPFTHGKPVDYLNRHAILHGADKAYGSKQNAAAAILWIDYLLVAVVDEQRRRAELVADAIVGALSDQS